MDRSKLGQAAVGKKGADLNKRMQRRIFVYLAASGLLLVVWLMNRPAPEPAPTARTPLDTVDIPDDRPRQPRAEVDPARLAPVRDDTRAARALLDPDASQHLLEQSTRLAYGDLDALGLEPGDHARLAADGRGLRGRPFWVLGEIRWWESEVVDRLPRTRGEIIDADGNSWAFLVVVEPFNVEPGDVVRMAGFYLKQYDLRRPSGEFVTAPLLVGEELLASAYRIEPVTALRDDLFEDVFDADLAQANEPLDSPAFYELLSYAKHAPDEVVYPDEPLADMQPVHLLRDPDAWRGETVKLTGVLLYLKQAPLGPRGENPLGVPFVWQLWVSDNRSGDAGTMLVLSLDEPAAKERDIVEIEGVFYRRWAFENKANRPRIVPVIMARSVETYVPGETTLTPMLMKIIVGVVAVVVVLLVVAQNREKHAALKARNKRVRRKGKLIQLDGRLATAAAGAGDAPAGAPATTVDAGGGAPADTPGDTSGGEPGDSSEAASDAPPTPDAPADGPRP